MVKNVFKKLGKKQKNNKGFSLVELIVVIAIMAVLVGVLAPQFIKYVEKSTDMQSVQQLKSSVETDISDNENVTSATIAISGKKATTTITASSGTVTPSTSSAALKSSGWPTITYTLDPGTGAWSTTATATTNTKNPKKDMNEVFSISK